MTQIRRIFVYAAVIILAAVLGANVYNSIVDAPNWGASIPRSLETARAYFSVANPGTFYRAASPLSQIACLSVLILTWPLGKRVRVLAAAALLLAIFGDVLTFAYFYPRNAVLFGNESVAVDAATEAWRGWSSMNWVRSGICLAAVICQLCVLSRIEAINANRALG